MKEGLLSSNPSSAGCTGQILEPFSNGPKKIGRFEYAYQFDNHISEKPTHSLLRSNNSLLGFRLL